jgi:hypothetical protein
MAKTQRKARQPSAKAPAEIRALLKATHGSYATAARYSGVSTGFLHQIGSGKYGASRNTLDKLDKATADIRAGKPEPEPYPNKKHASPRGDGELGIAICVFAGDNKGLGDLMDVGEALGGSWAHRQKIENVWLLVLKLPDKDKLMTFAKVAKVLANITTP